MKNNYFNIEANSELELNIIKVGHGNWNEIRSGKTRIFYDTGADKRWRQLSIRDLIDTMDIRNDHDIHIVISHWDVDHYHALLEFESKHFKRIKSIIAPSNPPKTNTCTNVIQLLKLNNVHLEFIKPVSVSNGPLKEIKLGLYRFDNIIDVYRATNTKNRNQGGIVLLVKGKNCDALLTGDHHYSKLYKYILNGYSNNDKPLIFITPHHGGYAGKWDINNWKQLNIREVAISYCQSNPYNHPTRDNLSKLITLNNGNVSCTTRRTLNYLL
ncbi:hypothetical protein P4V41_02960 [Fictibacillus nanhaiensis]|uniref:hypothetical protein n=1 Tax=Fictibacillus nanhaiensis TaxID=742169 RepID=UPI002E1EAEF4|nr:hypothetical protein [Fictibacillus nanhaiensis]